MSERDPGIIIADMPEAAERIREYTEGTSFDQFRNDTKTSDAVLKHRRDFCRRFGARICSYGIMKVRLLLPFLLTLRQRAVRRLGLFALRLHLTTSKKSTRALAGKIARIKAEVRD